MLEDLNIATNYSGRFVLSWMFYDWGDLTEWHDPIIYDWQ